MMDPISETSGTSTLTQNNRPVSTELSAEEQYLQLVRDILKNGIVTADRTGVGTRSVFGIQMKFSLRGDVIPVLTTKRVFWRGVAEELLWMLRGSTDAKELASRGVHIWDANGTRSFLDARGLHDRAEGDLGPVYGWQWRHSGAQYTYCGADYRGQGFDQLRYVIDQILTQPDSRRILMSAWNPSDLNKMALPPCHVMAQFRVSGNELHCMMTQRSADVGLGMPFNIASYSLLTHLIAEATRLKPGMFIYSVGDAHIYLNHCEALTAQVQNKPLEFPRLRILKRFACERNTDAILRYLEGLRVEDFELIGYVSHGAVALQMAV